ncbi:hypothetical protein MHK_004067, partial [Candidatus Magnetomorum sp. HK-1]
SINDKPDFVINQEKIDVLEDFEGTETIVVTPLPIPFGEENQSVIYSLSPASYTIANVSIDSETGLVSISKIDNMFGEQIITIIANDQQSQNNTYEKTFTLNITSINDKPDFVINQEKIDVLEDFEGTETIVVTPLPIPFGEENQSVIYSLSPASYTIANVSIDSETGLVSIFKIDNMFGEQIITIIANDQQSQNNTYEKTVTLNINSYSINNDAPKFSINKERIDILEDFEGIETIVVKPSAIPFGEDDQSVVYSLSPSQYTIANVSIDSKSGEVTITKKDDMFGEQIITIIANDQQSYYNTYKKTFMLNIWSVNDEPAFCINTDKIEVDEDFEGEKTIVVDPLSIPFGEDDQIVIYSLSTASYTIANISIDSEDGKVSITKKDNMFGEQVISIIAYDQQRQNSIYEQTFTLNITNINDAPDFTINQEKIDVFEDFEGTETIVVTPSTIPYAEDNQSIIYSLSPASYTIANISINSQTGLVSITKKDNMFGVQNIKIIADDQQNINSKYEQTFFLNIKGLNDPPAFRLNKNQINVFEDFEGTETFVLFPLTIPYGEENQSVSYSLSPTEVSFAHISIDKQTGNISITSRSNLHGEQDFIVMADDSQSENNEYSQQFTLTVNPVNDAPELTRTTAEPTPINEDHFFDPILFTYKDIDSSSLTLTVDTDYTFFSKISICSGSKCQECFANNCSIPLEWLSQNVSIKRALRVIQGMTGIKNSLIDEQDIDQNSIIGLPESIYYLKDTSTAGSLSLHLTPATNESGVRQLTLVVSDGKLTAEHLFSIEVVPDSDPPELTVYDVTVDEDKLKDLIIDVELTDITEELSQIKISEIPSSVDINKCTTGNNECLLNKADLPGLQISPPYNSSDDITLQVSVSSQDKPDDKAEVSKSIKITVNPVADKPTVEMQSNHVYSDEEKPVQVTFKTLNLVDTDKSETLDRIEITNFPPNATYSEGSIENGILTIPLKTTDDKSGWGFTITPSGSDGESYAMNIKVYSKDKDKDNNKSVENHTDVVVNLSITKQTINENVSGSCFISSLHDTITNHHLFILIMLFMISFWVTQWVNIKKVISIVMLLFLINPVNITLADNNILAKAWEKCIAQPWQSMDYYTFKPMITMQSMGEGQLDEVFLLNTSASKTEYSSPLGFQFGAGWLKKNNYIIETTFEFISSFSDDAGGKTNSVDVINLMMNGKKIFNHSDKWNWYGLLGLGVTKSQQDIGFRGKSVSLGNFGLNARIGAGGEWKYSKKISFGMELTTNMGIGNVDFVKYNSINLMANYYFDERKPQHQIEHKEPEVPIVDSGELKEIENKIVAFNSKIELIKQNNGIQYAPDKFEEMKHYYSKAVKALKEKNLDEAQTNIDKAETDRGIVITEMKKAVYHEINRLNSFSDQLDQANFAPFKASIEKAKQLTEKIKIVAANEQLKKTEKMMTKMLVPICNNAQSQINNASELIRTLQTSDEVIQKSINRSQGWLEQAINSHKKGKCKDAIKEAKLAKTIAEAIDITIITKDKCSIAENRIDEAKKILDDSKSLADTLRNTYDIKIPDQLQLIVNHVKNASNAFKAQKCKAASKYADYAIKAAQKFNTDTHSLAKQIFDKRLAQLIDKFNKIDQHIEKLSFQIFSNRISIQDSQLNDIKQKVKDLNVYNNMKLLDRFKRLKSAQDNVRKIENNLDSIQLRPVNSCVIIEAAGDDPKAIDFIKAKNGLVDYLQQLQKYRIPKNSIDVNAALGYQDQLQFMESIDEIKDSYPMFQADSTFLAQFEKAINSFTYDEELRRLVYIISSRRTFIIPDDLDREISKLQQKNIAFSCIYIYSVGNPSGKGLEEMARQTDGNFYPCKNASMIRDALKSIFKQ